MQQLDQVEYGGRVLHHRPGTTDLNTIKEVFERRAYRRTGFDVEAGEHWLDLGANIGAFTAYCLSRGATATGYEPEPGCFEVLQLNAPGCVLHRAAVTAQHVSTIPFYVSRQARVQSRGSEYQVRRSRDNLVTQPLLGEVPNLWAGELAGLSFSGIKMDIEGSEGPLLDEWLLPRAGKLAMEYHTSWDPDVGHLAARVATLRAHYEHVQVPPELLRAIEGTAPLKPFFDRSIFAWKLF